MTFDPDIRQEWILDGGVAFLNHGSFGATPRKVLAAQAAWRERLEREPVLFLDHEYPRLLRDAAAALAEFLGARSDDLVFVDNATSGVNAVVRSLRFEPGDEILTTVHAYGAVRKALAYVARRERVRVVEALVPFPIRGPDEVVAVVEQAMGPRTRLAVLDHVTSSTALLFPVERLVGLCRERDVPVLLDGAHAPGMLPLDLEGLGADWYTGNCHKWLCAPKGCGFLWARRDRQDGLHPTVISHGYEGGFLREFDWTGTRDPSPYLSVTAALDFHRQLGPERVRRHNHALVGRAAALLARAWGVERPAPETMLGSMATLPLPGGGRVSTEDHARALNRHLRESAGVEVPIIAFGHRGWVRVSAQVYNRIEEYERLARAMGPEA